MLKLIVQSNWSTLPHFGQTQFPFSVCSNHRARLHVGQSCGTFPSTIFTLTFFLGCPSLHFVMFSIFNAFSSIAGLRLQEKPEFYSSSSFGLRANCAVPKTVRRSTSANHTMMASTYLDDKALANLPFAIFVDIQDQYLCGLIPRL